MSNALPETRIFIVDPDTDFLAWAATHLKADGVRIFTYERAEEAIAAQQGILPLSRRLVALKEDVDVRFALDDAKVDPKRADAAVLDEEMHRLGFNRHAQDLRSWLGVSGKSAGSAGGAAAGAAAVAAPAARAKPAAPALPKRSGRAVSAPAAPVPAPAHAPAAARVSRWSSAARPPG